MAAWQAIHGRKAIHAAKTAFIAPQKPIHALEQLGRLRVSDTFVVQAY
jgi:hypothetical protein